MNYKGVGFVYAQTGMENERERDNDDEILGSDMF